MASSPDNNPAAMPPRPGSGPGTEIDPQLESVLRNLNVNLEDELTRYRRQRHGRVPPPPPPRRAAQRKTLDLISVAATPGDAAPVDPPMPPPPMPPPPISPPPPPPNPFLKQPLSESEEDPELAELEQMMVQDEASVLESEDEVLPVPVGDMSTEGYLESSEELLKSIAEEQTEPETVPEPYSPERKNNSLLKLAGLVLVLLGGVGVGFAITYPSQLQNLRSQIWPAGEPDDVEITDTTETPDEPVSPVTPSAPEPAATSDGYKPPGPDLSTREFKELDDVQDLVTLELDNPKGGGTPLPSVSNPAQTPIPTTPSQPAAQPPETPSPDGGSPASVATTAPAPVATPTPAATPTPTPTPTTGTQTIGSNFYVVSPYTGDASLNKARELVPDAFVRNFKAGARIQLAAFDNQAQAEDQVAALTQQGAVVELFGPTNE